MLRSETEVDHPVVADGEPVADVEADVPDLRITATAANAGTRRTNDLAVHMVDLGRPVRLSVASVAFARQQRGVVVHEVASATADRSR